MTGVFVQAPKALARASLTKHVAYFLTLWCNCKVVAKCQCHGVMPRLHVRMHGHMQVCNHDVKQKFTIQMRLLWQTQTDLRIEMYDEQGKKPARHKLSQCSGAGPVRLIN